MLPARALLLFLDGVGIGSDDPALNPFVTARLPTLRSLLDGAVPTLDLLDGPVHRSSTGAVLVAADANLGLPGLPQSGTGQTTLLTGMNAAERFGRHFGPWVPVELREMLERESVLARAVAARRRAAFANAHPAGYLEGRIRRPAAPPLAARAAGLLRHHGEALRRRRAIASSITNTLWRVHLDPTMPEISARDAGAVLGEIAAEAELTLFAHYDTDHVGHRGDRAAAVAVLERVDDFLAGTLATLPADALLVIASDHGNIEDASTGHTRNPVPVLAVGPGSEVVARRVRSIADVAPVLESLLAGEEHPSV